MREREIEGVQKPQEPTLRESFGYIKISKKQLTAMEIIDGLDLNPNQKKYIFFFHLFHETGSFAPIKKYEDLRETMIESMLNRVWDDDNMVSEYDRFYQEFVAKTEPEKDEIPPKHIPGELQEVLKAKELTKEEERAAQAIDVLKISIQDKQILFAAHLFFGSGGAIRARDQFGVSIDKTVGARDRVRTNPRYEDLWQKLEFLLKPNFAEVAILKKSFPHKKIAEILEVGKPRVDEISKALIAKGIIEPSPKGRFKARQFAEFVKEVEKLEAPNISDKEIAQKLGETETRVKRARKRLRIKGNARQRTPKNVARSQGKARRLLPLRTQVKELVSRGYTTREIAVITGATFQQVKHQRSIKE